MGDPLASFGFLDPLAYAGGGPTFTLAQQPMGACAAQQATAAVSERDEKRGPAFLRIQHPLNCPAPCALLCCCCCCRHRGEARRL